MDCWDILYHPCMVYKCLHWYYFWSTWWYMSLMILFGIGHIVVFYKPDWKLFWVDCLVYSSLTIICAEFGQSLGNPTCPDTWTWNMALPRKWGMQQNCNVTWARAWCDNSPVWSGIIQRPENKILAGLPKYYVISCTATTWKYTDVKIYEQFFKTTSGKVFLGQSGHLNVRNPIHFNIR